MATRILLKYSASQCNKDILYFLSSNINEIQQSIPLKVIIVYDEMINKLGGKIKKLPAMVYASQIIVGNADIQKFISDKIGQGKNGNSNNSVKSKVEGLQSTTNNDLNDFWNSEMHSGEDESNTGEGSDEMVETMKSRALNQTLQHNEQLKPRTKKRESVMTTSDDSNMSLSTDNDNISQMDDDPIIQKFWENQESTPGFE
jgi:hypothetical protein